MTGTALLAILIVAIGTRATDAVRVRQQEIILAKLPTPEAGSYYQVLKRRRRTTRFLRVVALVSLVAILYARNHAWQRSHQSGPRDPGAGSGAPTSPR